MNLAHMILSEEIKPRQNRGAVVAVGRLNPPTRGHHKLIKAMKAYVREHPELGLSARPIVVIVAGKKTSEDLSRNPLTPEQRQQFLETSGKANGVRILHASNAFEAFAKVREAGFEPIAVAAGSDRAKEYMDILDKHFKDGEKTIKHHVVPGLGREDEPIGSKKQSALDKLLDKMKEEKGIDDEEVSASLARRAVELNYFPEFMEIVGLEKNKAAAKRMFQLIKAAIDSTRDEEE